MRKLFLVALTLLACYSVQPAAVVDAESASRHVLLYVNKSSTDGMTPEEIEALPSIVQRKGVFPALKNALLEAEIVDQYQLIKSQGDKAFFWLWVSTDGKREQITRIKEWILDFNGCPEGVTDAISNQCTTAYNQRVLFWRGDTMKDAYRAMWQDRTEHSFILTLLKNILKYPIRKNTGNEEHPIFASVADAETTYGLTIEWKQALPYRILAGERWGEF